MLGQSVIYKLHKHKPEGIFSGFEKMRNISYYYFLFKNIQKPAFISLGNRKPVTIGHQDKVVGDIDLHDMLDVDEVALVNPKKPFFERWLDGSGQSFFIITEIVGGCDFLFFFSDKMTPGTISL